MNTYHKINNLFKLDPNTHKRIIGDWTEPEFEFLAGNEWVGTEKVDGTNIRVMVTPGDCMFGGKTDNAQMPAPLVNRLQERFLPQQERLDEMFPDGGCLYGEGYGGKIQKGSKYRADQDFVLFDVKVGDYWLRRPDVEGIAEDLELDVVPIVRTGNLLALVNTVLDGFKSQWGDFDAEGLVARPAVELTNRYGGRIITKIKCRDF